MKTIYDNINELYDESVLYDNEFAKYDDDFVFWKYWVKELLGDGTFGRVLKA